MNHPHYPASNGSNNAHYSRHLGLDLGFGQVSRTAGRRNVLVMDVDGGKILAVDTTTPRG